MMLELIRYAVTITIVCICFIRLYKGLKYISRIGDLIKSLKR